ncbi:hypothetical protein ES703_39264 [subsurface metagenome]|jgi:hypothetical protein
MKTLPYKKGSKQYWNQFRASRESRANKMANMPYAKKIAIIEKLRDDYSLISKSRSSLKAPKT